MIIVELHSGAVFDRTFFSFPGTFEYLYILQSFENSDFCFLGNEIKYLKERKLDANLSLVLLFFQSVRLWINCCPYSRVRSIIAWNFIARVSDWANDVSSLVKFFVHVSHWLNSESVWFFLVTISTSKPPYQWSNESYQSIMSYQPIYQPICTAC